LSERVCGFEPAVPVDLEVANREGKKRRAARRSFRERQCFHRLALAKNDHWCRLPTQSSSLASTETSVLVNTMIRNHYMLRWRLAVATLLLLAPGCQDAIDRLVPGEQPQDGRSRLVQLGQDKSSRSGSGAPGSPALIHAEAQAGTHLAVWADGGVVRSLEEHPTHGSAEQCLILPTPSSGRHTRVQFLVESARPKFTVLVGLAMLGAGTGASSRLEAICPDAFLLDQAELSLEPNGSPSPEGDGGESSGGSGGVEDEGAGAGGEGG
jgi:hypothetical protein